MNIALFLSSDGIALAHRQTAGHWAMVGETAIDVPDLGTALSGLRALAIEREGDAFEALLVLPDDQILYTSLTAPTADPALTAHRIEDGLEGLTPYAVTELEYDWRALEEDRVKIAVVARETLDEARAFAAQYGFTCKGFAAMPPMERFPGVPTFDLGDEVEAMGFTAEGIAFGPDDFSMPEAAPELEQKQEETTAVTEPLAPAVTVQEPATPTPPEAAAPQTEPATPELEPWDQNLARGEALRDADAAAEWDADLDDDHPVQPIHDPSVSGPIASIASDREPAPEPEPAPIAAPPEQIAAPQEVVGDAGDDDDALPPAPSPAVLAARQSARALLRGVTPPGNKGPDTGETGAFSASRGPAQTPEGVDRAVGSAQAPETPASGRPAPMPERGVLLGQRSSRLGLPHPDGPTSSGPADNPPVQLTAPAETAPPMASLAEHLQRVRDASKSRPSGPAATAPQPARPRVEITPRAGPLAAEARPPARFSPFEPAPEASPVAPTRPGRFAGIRLAGIVNRIKAVTPKPTPPDVDADPDADEPSEQAPPTSSAPRSGGAAASLTGLLRRREKAAGDAPELAMSAVGDETFASGLLARKSVKASGGSFKTGLVLTIILLLLLALIAIWSAIFLPNSAVARLLGVGSGEVVIASGQPPPDASSSTPAFGTTDGSVPADAVQPSLADEAAADGVELAEDGAAVAGPSPTMATDALALGTPEQEALPDIDAELDLPPLPVIDQGQNPSLEEAQALYAEDGIWARSPERPDLAPFDLRDEIYTASIDPEVSDFDAVALPDPAVNPSETLRRFPPPPPFGTEFDLTEDGLLAPTPEGVLTPEGAFVILGTPPGFIAPPRPREVAPRAPAIDSDEAVLGTFRPAERPVDLAETRERQVLGGLTEVELSARRPAARPASPQETAAQASLFPGGDSTTDPDAVDAAVAQALEGTELAIARSLLPRARPGNIAQLVASADRTPTQAPTAVAATAVARAPSIPSNADVSRAATERNAIRLRDVNLVGVSGSSSDRRALVRLASGRFVRVTVGDRLDGGRVAAIGETTLQYVRRGRTVTLEIPG